MTTTVSTATLEQVKSDSAVDRLLIPVKKLKILLISTTIFPLPPQGYAGLEMIVYDLACEYQKAGHEVTVVAPEGSKLPDGIALFPVPLRCSEEDAWKKYRDILPQFDICHDNTFGSWIYLSTIGIDPPLPIVKTHHTDPSVWLTPPPVPHPNLVGLSADHARRLALHHGLAVKHVYNGLNLGFYKADLSLKRNGRILHISRYTAEKGVLESIQLAKKLRMPLDCYGDTEIVGDISYIDRCRKEADGVMVRVFPAVSREKTVELYQSYRAFLFTPNWSEPFGLCVAEAQACGMPIFTLSRGAMSEIVKNEVSGYVCPSINDLEEKLKAGCWAKIKPEECVEWASRFSKENMARNYLKLFDDVLAGNWW